MNHLYEIKESLSSNKYPIRRSELYKKTKKYMKHSIGQNMTINNKTMEILPDINRQIIYIAGPSGVGKSYFTSKYCEKYHKIFSENDIYLFSRKNEDPAFDKHKYIKRILIDESFIDDPIHPEELKNALVIFDDSHTFRGKLKKEIMNTQTDLMDLGRAGNTNMIITSHLMTNYAETRSVLNECSAIVVYPESGSYHQMKYTLCTYFNIDKNDIKKILKLKSRWCYINKFPKYAVHEGGIFVL
jgi:hypothetical protein